MKKTTIIILTCMTIVLGIAFGVILSYLDNRKLEEAQINEIRKFNELVEGNIINTNKVIEVNQANVKLSPNAVIYFEKYYKDCKHTITDKEAISQKEVNKTEEYFKEVYSDWQIKSFSADKVVLYKEIEGNCDKHYLITVKDGNIAVYTIDSEGNKALKEQTDIAVQYLPKEDVQLLKEGITANGDNELAKKLEDYE